MSGLILLVFLGMLIAYGWARTRRRLGLAVTSRTYLAVIAAVVVAGLMLWAYSTHQ